MLTPVIILAAAGFFIACYAWLTKIRLKHSPSYKAFCDISNNISCTRPMKSSYANLFFIANSVVAVLYFVLIAFLGFYELQSELFVLSAVGALASCLLAYVLFFKVKDFCVLCISLYMINIALFAFMLHTYVL